MPHRINNPTSIDASSIENCIATGDCVIVQYSRATYSTDDLIALNELCKVHGRNLELRFYDHASSFDASVLELVADAHRVSLDCLKSASNLEALTCLGGLKELNLGVYELSDENILARLHLSSLESLTIGAARTTRLDLSPLAACSKLKRFHTTGHTKNIGAICHLPSLRELSLSSIKRAHGLSFVSKIERLSSLRIMLGGRVSIADVESPNLKAFEIIRVQGLEEVGDLSRFRELERLTVEDQLKLRSIRVGANPKLRELAFINCKSLNAVDGVEDLGTLEDLRMCGTALRFEEFISRPMPISLKTITFLTGKSKRDAEIEADLQARGFRQTPRF